MARQSLGVRQRDHTTQQISRKRFIGGGEPKDDSEWGYEREREREREGESRRQTDEHTLSLSHTHTQSAVMSGRIFQRVCMWHREVIQLTETAEKLCP